MLKATEKVDDNRGGTTDELGNEIDLVLKFKLYDQLTWNWQFGTLMAARPIRVLLQMLTAWMPSRAS